MGYKVRINGEDVWESVGDPMLVDRVSINNARGEVTVIGSANTDEYMDIEVNVRDPEGPLTYLDIIEAKAANERRDTQEAAAAEVRAEEAKAAKAEAKKKTEDKKKTDEVKSVSDVKAEKEAMADVEF